MANLQKYNRQQLGHLLKHYNREKDQYGRYIQFGNLNINTNFTHLNYNLAPKHKDDYKFIKQRCKDLKALNRKDVNVMCSWVVTVPQEYWNNSEAISLLDSADSKDNKNKYLDNFFQETYNFLEDKYGKENIISANVHMDETTPHMHFAFVPVVWDIKKQRNKVSAKECVNRKDLQQFHPQLNKYLNKALKRELKELEIADIGVLTNKDRDSMYLDKKALKRKINTLEKDNIKLQAQIKEQQKYMENIKFKDGRSAYDRYKQKMAKTKQKQQQKQSKFKQVKRFRPDPEMER